MKRISILALLSVIVTFFVACESAKVKDTEVKSTKSDPGQIFAQSSNEQLANIPVAGFGYKDSQVPAQQWDDFAKKAAPVIKNIIDNMPDGYVLQVTGHTDGSGPEEPVGNKPGNIKISSDRANQVFEALKKNGVTSPKMTFKGVGSAEPLEGVDARDAKQRRVTFKVVPKQ